MRHRSRYWKMVLATALGLVWTTGAWAVTVDGPSVSTTYVGHLCGAGCWCSTGLDPLKHVAAPTANDTFDKLLKAAYPNWTITYGGALSGIIHVTTYDAHLCDPYVLPSGWQSGDPIPPRNQGVHCAHGAELVMWYERGADDPALPAGQTYHWIQRFLDWGGYCGYLTAPHDVIDCTLGPYYYDPGEEQSIVAKGHEATWYLDAPQSGCAMKGDSCPGDKCPKPCHWGADVWTFLAIGTPGGQGTGTMTVYDGVTWGFTANCVPEPVLMSLLAFAAGTCAMLRRVRQNADTAHERS